MQQYFILLLVAIFWTQSAPATGWTAGITNYPKLNTAAFWQNLTPANHTIIMSPPEIAAFNQQIIAVTPTVYDLQTYPKTLAASQLQTWLTAAQEVLAATVYKADLPIDLSEKRALRTECNLQALAPQNPVCYGVIVRRTNLRTLPTTTALFNSPGDRNFDILQEAAVDPSEPIIILHSSQSGAFKYIQMRNYRGWVATADIAIATPQQWLSYVRPQKFLIVTANKFATTLDSETIIYQMGAKISLLNVTPTGYNVQIPTRTVAGNLANKSIFIPATAPVHQGFLPYSRCQIIQQSFQFLHDPYGWGGLNNSVDCSAFIAAIYRTVGIELPRNADEQEQTAGVHFPLNSLNPAQKRQALHNLQAGDVLFFAGHTMLYLGETNGTPFIIHSLGSHTKHYADGRREKINTMQVVISDLTLQRYSSITFMDALTSAVAYH